MARFIYAVTSASAVPDSTARLYAEWIRAGHHAGMDYLDRHHALRRHPERLLENVAAVAVMAFPYPPADADSGICPGIAAYALGDDYHDALRDYLNPIIDSCRRLGGGEWRLCIDSAPIPERFWAVNSGLARPTRSGNVTVEGLGTRFFLATLLSTLSPQTIGNLIHEVCGEDGIRHPPGTTECADPAEMMAQTCGSCRLCLDACPGKAIGTDATVDARRCLSYLTIEHRGEWLDSAAIAAISSPAGRHTLFGCDICVRCCPLNTAVSSAVTPLEAFKARKEYVNLTPRGIVDMTQEEFSATFRRSAIKRAKLAGLRRNALNCLGLRTEETYTDNQPISL